MASKTGIIASFFVLAGIVGISDANAQGQKVSRIPDVVGSQNSQTMNLLEGHLNLNPTAPPRGELAVVDGSALVAENTASGDAFTESGSSQISTYIVREGDNLSSIAKMFGVSVNTIAWANDVRGGRLSIGQELVILPISGVKHTVAKGDTLQSIAKKYKADLGDILAYNGLASDAKLTAGDVVIVPDGEIAVSVNSTLGSGATSNLPTYAGFYMRPLSGGRKTQGIHGHNGVDLGGLPIGAPVMAAADGVVIIARTSGWNGGYGLYVVIRHSNGTQTLYAHLSQVNVSVGTPVSQGQTIGKLGNTGKSTGPHLHFEVRGAKNPF